MKKVRKAIIPAAGLGTRFLPATKAIPKEMFPLIDKPTIQYIVEEAVQSGIEDIIIVTGRNKRTIEDYFDRNIELEMNLIEKQKHEMLKTIEYVSNLANIHYVRQKQPLGLGHAIWCARKFIGDEPFAVLLGDIISDSTRPCLKELVDIYHDKQSSVIAVESVDWSEVSKYGIIKGEKLDDNLYLVKSLIEKPRENPPSNLAITGRYVLDPDIFEILQNTQPGAGGEIQLTDALQGFTRKNQLFALLHKEKLYDVGNKMGFLKALIELACKNKELKDEFSHFLKLQCIKNDEH